MLFVDSVHPQSLNSVIHKIPYWEAVSFIGQLKSMASLKNSASKWALCFECNYIGNKSALHLVILDDLLRFQ